MKKLVVYIHGKGGNEEEADHYKELFPEQEVVGLDYESQTPWDAIKEFGNIFDSIQKEYDSVVLVANSIGAFFAMNALSGFRIEKAYFISPIVNMEKLITDMMQWAGVTETELMEKGTIETSFGESLSWEYLVWLRKHPASWSVPTSVLYGSKDNLQSLDTIKAFAKECGADLTVMQNGEHWFHTQEQMDFLDEWIKSRNAAT